MENRFGISKIAGVLNGVKMDILEFYEIIINVV
jgi:hypothetical protein